MKTFIVPTDLSETSMNAAVYAVQLAAEVKDAKIILYNVFNKSSASGERTQTGEQLSMKNDMEVALESVKTNMLNTNASVEITCVAEENDSLINSIERFAMLHKADLIVMGITESSRMNQVLKGSNTLNMVHKNACPVIIVPAHVQFKSIKNVLLASDFHDVDNTTPVKSISAVLNLFQPNVHVVNVDAEHFVELSETYKTERAKMEAILSGYKTAFYFIRQYDFVEAIARFAVDKDIDLILTVPRKHSFFSNLFRTSHTKKLAYNSDVAILAVHE